MRSLALLLLLASPALAQEPSDTLTAEDKALYLRCAYIINGNSMVGTPAFTSIDMTKWTKEQLQECVAPQPVVVAEPLPDTWPAIDKPAKPVLDVCAKHNMRKVFTDGGSSWRCRK